MEVDKTKLEFFCKLGYTEINICKALEKLGQDALVNDILNELIKMGNYNRAEPEDWAERASTPKLVARGCSPPQRQEQALTPSEEEIDSSSNLRPIIIDGSNVAMSHGNKESFSCRGIELAVKFFESRGHRVINAFVPAWRKEQPRPDTPITDQHILEELEKRRILVYTPSRKVNGKRVVCYDDRYIVRLAYDMDGIIVSNDNYRDLQNENPEWKRFIETKLLMYSFVNDKFMPPDDPLGRRGPTLDNFLRKRPKISDQKWQRCPYGRKCTYGNKCKFYHPERSSHPQLSVADELRAKTKCSTRTAKSDHLQRKKTTIISLEVSNGQSTNSWMEKPQQNAVVPYAVRNSATTDNDITLIKNQLSQTIIKESSCTNGSMRSTEQINRKFCLNGCCMSNHKNDSYDMLHAHSMDCACSDKGHVDKITTFPPYTPSCMHRCTRIQSPPVICGQAQMQVSHRPQCSCISHMPRGKSGTEAHSCISYDSLYLASEPSPHFKHNAKGYLDSYHSLPKHTHTDTHVDYWWGNNHFKQEVERCVCSESIYEKNISSNNISEKKMLACIELCSDFSHSEVDQVMALHPDVLDVPSLVSLIHKYRSKYSEQRD